jgi:ketosteroid isomerase-like protein
MAVHDTDTDTDVEADTDRAAIAAVVETYRAGFASLDGTVLRSIWDPEFPTIYSAIELDEPLHGKDEIDAYYERVTQNFGSASVMRIDDLAIEADGDLAFAFFTFHFEGSFAHAPDEPFVVDGRTTIVLRRTEAGWKGIHHHESRPLATEVDD